MGANHVLNGARAQRLNLMRGRMSAFGGKADIDHKRRDVCF